MKLSNMLNSAVVYSAKSDIRFYLKGVNIYYKDCFIYAMSSTDGHCMQTLLNNKTVDDFTMEYSGLNSVIISNSDCKRLAAIFPSQSVDEVAIDDILKIVTPIKGNYPDVRRVIPSDLANHEALEIGINYKYLAKVSQSMAKLGKGVKTRYDSAKFTFKGAKEAVRVDVDQPLFDGIKVLIVIMPMQL